MNPIVGGSACDVIDRLHMPTTQPLRDTVDNLIKKTVTHKNLYYAVTRQQYPPHHANCPIHY